MAIQKNLTISPRQEKYIRDNYRRMKANEICRNLKITENVFYQSVRLMKIEYTRKSKASIPHFETQPGYFNVEDYLANLVTI